MTNGEPTAMGRAYLVGAGPGAPGLITLRGIQCLAKADTVLYDYLVNPRILAHAPLTAECICLGRHGKTRVWSQAEIDAAMLASVAGRRHFEQSVESEQLAARTLHLHLVGPLVDGGSKVPQRDIVVLQRLAGPRQATQHVRVMGTQDEQSRTQGNGFLPVSSTHCSLKCEPLKQAAPAMVPRWTPLANLQQLVHKHQVARVTDRAGDEHRQSLLQVGQVLPNEAQGLLKSARQVGRRATRWTVRQIASAVDHGPVRCAADVGDTAVLMVPRAAGGLSCFVPATDPHFSRRSRLA